MIKARARLAEEKRVCEFGRRFEMSYQMVDVPTDARAAIVPRKIQEVRVETDAIRVVCHCSYYITNSRLVRSS